MKDSPLKIIHTNLKDILKHNVPTTQPSQNKTMPNHQTEPHQNYLNKQQISQRSSSKHSLKLTPPIRNKIKTESADTKKYYYNDQNNLYLHKVDVAFTDLEDYFCQLKEKVIANLQSILNNNSNSSNLNHYLSSITTMTHQIKNYANQAVNPKNNKQLHQITNSDKLNDISHLSNKNRKTRQHERRETLMQNKKKSVYQMVLLENKMKFQLSHKR